jgi:hypothetical protein
MVRQDAVETTGRESGVPSSTHPRVPVTRTRVRAGFAPSDPTRHHARSTANWVAVSAVHHDHRESRHPAPRSPRRVEFAPSDQPQHDTEDSGLALRVTRADNRPATELEHGRVLATRTRGRGRFAVGAIALVATAIVGVALVGGFSGGAPKQDLAAQDQAVALSNRLATIQEQHAAAQRQLAQTRRAVDRARTASVVATRRVSAVTVPHGQRTNTFADTLCTPTRARAGTGAQRRAQRALELRRKQALYYLNLSCPAV